MDLASIILSQSPYRSQAIRDRTQARLRYAGEKGDAISGFLSDEKNLIRKKIEEDDQKSVEDAFTQSYSMDGDLDGAMRAVQKLRPRTLAGTRAQLGLILKHDTLKKERDALNLEQQQRDALRSSFAPQMPTPLAPANASMPNPVNVLGQGFANTPALGTGFPMHQPSFDDALPRLAQSGAFAPKDVLPLMGRMDAADMRAEQTSQTERGRMSRAALTDNRIRELADANREATQTNLRAKLDNALTIAREGNKVRTDIATRAQDQRAKTDAEKLDLQREIHDDELAFKQEHLAFLKGTAELKAGIADENVRRQALQAATDSAAKYINGQRAEIRKARTLNPGADFSAKETALNDLETDVNKQLDELRAMGERAPRDAGISIPRSPAPGLPGRDAIDEELRKRGIEPPK